jgi:hypothetical protein
MAAGRSRCAVLAIDRVTLYIPDHVPDRREALVTTGPGDQAGRLRTSRADREQAISALKIAFVQGRLAKDEFDARVGQALTSRTHAELAVVTADIPAGPAEVQAIRAPGQPPQTVTPGVCVTVTASLLAAVLWSAALVAGSAAALAAALAVTGIAIFAFFVTVDQMREMRRRRRSGMPLPPGALPGSS